MGLVVADCTFKGECFSCMGSPSPCTEDLCISVLKHDLICVVTKRRTHIDCITQLIGGAGDNQ